MCVNVHGGLILPQAAMNAGLGLEQSAVINPQGKYGSIGPGVMIFEGKVKMSTDEAFPQGVKVGFDPGAIDNWISEKIKLVTVPGKRLVAKEDSFTTVGAWKERLIVNGPVMIAAHKDHLVCFAKPGDRLKCPAVSGLNTVDRPGLREVDKVTEKNNPCFPA